MSNIPRACSPICTITITAPIKPDAKPRGTPIEISAINPNITINESVPISIYFKSLAGSYCFSFGFFQSIIKLFTD